MPKIIISYRRSDTDAIAGRIRDKLAGHYGEDSVFMDIDSIPFGLDFREHIKDALLQNEMLIVVVGPRWLGQARGGEARIFDDTDPVRVEVETALQRGIPVIPVLVGGAEMPNPKELPEALENFAYRNAAPVDAGRDFHQHMDRLIRSMDKIFALNAKSGSTGVTQLGLPSGPLTEGGVVPPPAPPTAGRPTEPRPTEPHPPEARPTGPPPTEYRVATVAEPPASVPAVGATEGEAAPVTEGALPYWVSTRPSGSAAPPVTAERPPERSAGTTTAELRGRQSRRNRLLAAAAGACVLVIGAVWLLRQMPAPTPSAGPGGQEQPAPAPAPVPQPQPKKIATEPQRTPAQELAAAACKGGNAAFQDDFKATRAGWDLDQQMRGSKGYYVDGQLAIMAAEKASYGVLYAPLKFRNPTICAHVKSPTDDRTLATTGGGVIFWASNPYTYYVASVHPDGGYGIYRYDLTAVSVVVPHKRFESIKPGLGTVNEVVVALDGSAGSLIVNGVKVQDFRGEAPENESAVGLWVQSQEDRPTEWRFLDIVVNERK